MQASVNVVVQIERKLPEAMSKSVLKKKYFLKAKAWRLTRLP
jgi:hypothetical protein